MKHAGYYSDIEQGYTQERQEDLPRLLDQARASDAQLLNMTTTYLSGGYVLGDILSVTPDPLAPGMTLPMGTRTDGEWVWPADAALLCERHGILPANPDFQAKIRAMKGDCPIPDDEQLSHIKSAWYR